MIKLTEPIAHLSGAPYVIQVWDPPEWWMHENKFDAWTTTSVMRAFASALRNAQCCLAASWAMAEAYSHQYQCKATPVILGFAPDKVIPQGKRDSSEFVIALSGQIYASDEFNSLVQALDLMGWRYGEKKIVLRLYGRYFHLFFNTQSQIEIRGWLDQDVLLRELADADLLYCPYWFSETYRLPSALSFPSKLSTYLKTEVPVLIHAPEHASPRQFIVQNGAGYICDTMAPAGIQSILEMILAQSPSERQSVGAQGYRAFLHNLTLDHMRESFFCALGLDRDDGQVTDK